MPPYLLDTRAFLAGIIACDISISEAVSQEGHIDEAIAEGPRQFRFIVIAIRTHEDTSAFYQFSPILPHTRHFDVLAMPSLYTRDIETITFLSQAHGDVDGA